MVRMRWSALAEPILSRHDPGGLGIHTGPEIACQTTSFPCRARCEYPTHEREPYSAWTRRHRGQSWPAPSRRASGIRITWCYIGHTRNLADPVGPADLAKLKIARKERKSRLG
jgi:hypothetical protein